MRSAGRWLAALAVGVAGSAALVVSPAARLAPAYAAACSGTSGVTVVVDNGSSISTGCAAGDPSSALSALQAAGHTTVMVQTQPGFLCRIDGFPARDPCVRVPPTTAYWAFFYAERGGSWVYSASGATSYNPAPGTVVGFRFDSGAAPHVAPPAAVAPTPTPTRTAAPAPAPTRTAAPPAPAPRTTTAAPRTTTPPRATTTAPSATRHTSASASASATRSSTTGPSATTSSTQASETATPLAAAPSPSAPGAESGGGSPTGLLAGALLATGLGTAAVVVGRRRFHAN